MASDKPVQVGEWVVDDTLKGLLVPFVKADGTDGPYDLTGTTVKLLLVSIDNADNRYTLTTTTFVVSPDGSSGAVTNTAVFPAGFLSGVTVVSGRTRERFECFPTVNTGAPTKGYGEPSFVISVRRAP